jgi:hypothetical protein
MTIGFDLFYFLFFGGQWNQAGVIEKHSRLPLTSRTVRHLRSACFIQKTPPLDGKETP